MSDAHKQVDETPPGYSPFYFVPVSKVLLFLSFVFPFHFSSQVEAVKGILKQERKKKKLFSKSMLLLKKKKKCIICINFYLHKFVGLESCNCLL